MRIVSDLDDLSPSILYPEKRRYFSIYFMGHNIVGFVSCIKKYIPKDWPVIFFYSSNVNPYSIKFMSTASAMSNCVAFWGSSDSDTDFSIMPNVWSSQIGKYVSSNKKFFAGSGVPCVFKTIAHISGYDNWYINMDAMCKDLSQVIKDQLIESVTTVSSIQVTTRAR